MKFVLLVAFIGLALADDQVAIVAPESEVPHHAHQKFPEGFKHAGRHVRAAAATPSCGIPSTLTSTQQQQSITTHNTLRAQEGAANMVALTYSEEMARCAQAYANQCIWAHGMLNDCEGNALGQNLFVTSNSAGYPALNLTSVVIQWYNEKADYTAATSTCAAGKECGHYTQVAWARSAQVGCGFAQCPTMKVGSQTWTNCIYVVCDYTPAGNVIGDPMQLPGAPASNCDSDNTGAGYKPVGGLCATCTPATDPACKCGAPQACVTGNWNAGTCQCDCPSDHYGQLCEIPCTCGDAADCSVYPASTNLCIDPALLSFRQQYCKATCSLPCTSLPASCTKMAM